MAEEYVPGHPAPGRNFSVNQNDIAESSITSNSNSMLEI